MFFVSILLFDRLFPQIKQLFEKNIDGEKVALEGQGFRPVFLVKIPHHQDLTVDIDE